MSIRSKPAQRFKPPSWSKAQSSARADGCGSPRNCSMPRPVKNLWSQRWDRPAADVFAIQSEISEQIANRLGGGNGLIQEAGRIAAHRKPPSNLTAYELYLLGTEKLEQINRADVEEAIRLLQPRRRDRSRPGPGLGGTSPTPTRSSPILAPTWRANYKLRHRSRRARRAARSERRRGASRLCHEFWLQATIWRAPRRSSTSPCAWRPTSSRFWPSTSPGHRSFGEAERGAKLVDEAIRAQSQLPDVVGQNFRLCLFHGRPL